MKERPILFSAPMVCAILEGRKTQTRRALKEQPPWDSGDIEPHKDYVDEWFFWHNGEPQRSFHCPYGKPRDRLWVRETFSYWVGYPVTVTPCWYWADGNPNVGNFTKPKPSIHMPRWASRITLEIVHVRVERLRNISLADAKAEAPPQLTTKLSVYPGTGAAKVERELDAVSCFAHLWDTINGDGSWNSNPWVWVVEFRRIT